MPSDAPPPLAAPIGPRPERVGGLPLARVDPRRAPAGADRRLRGRRRNVQPDDLPEGDERGRRLRRAAPRARSAQRPATWRRPSGRWPSRTSGTPATSSGPSGRAAAAATATSRWRSIRGSPTTRCRPSARRCACTTSVHRPNLMVKIPATKPGLAAIEDVDRQGPLDQRHADLLAAPLRRGGRVLHARHRAPGRRGRRPEQGGLGRELLRLAHRHRG